MAAKRYHQSIRDRKDEAYGEGKMMGRREGNMDQGYYEGPMMRRKQEMEDGGMIREDRSAIANLPQEVMMKAYPKTGPYIPEDLDDTIRGVDMQMDSDDSLRRKTFAPHKY